MVHPLTQTQDKAKPLEPEPILLLTTSGTSEGQAVKPEVTAQQEPTWGGRGRFPSPAP